MIWRFSQANSFNASAGVFGAGSVACIIKEVETVKIRVNDNKVRFSICMVSLLAQIDIQTFREQFFSTFLRIIPVFFSFIISTGYIA